MTGRRDADDTGLVVLKFALIGALYGVVIATFGDTAGGIVALAATVGAIGYLFSKVIVPAVGAIKLIQELPRRLTDQDEKLEAIEKDTALIKDGALAAAERAETAMKIARDVAGKLGVGMRSDDP